MCKKLLADNIDVALIQELWLSGGKIRGLRCKAGSIISPYCDNPKACIYVKNRINAMANLRFCSTDATTMEVSGGNKSTFLNVRRRQVIDLR